MTNETKLIVDDSVCPNCVTISTLKNTKLPILNYLKKVKMTLRRYNNSKQIGCEGEDATFVACCDCLYINDMHECHKTMEEGNLKIVTR